jgi:GDP-L-fucose synthase
MKRLLLGANGYIGSSLTADLRVGRQEVDLTDYKTVLNLFIKHQPNHIISAASKHGSFRDMQTDHHSYLRENFLIDSHILDAAAKCGIENVSILSSISGLPESSQPSDEGMISTGPVAESNFGYNFSKYASTQLVKSYQLDGFTGYRSFLLGNVYGYNFNFERNTNVVATLIKLMHKAMITDTNLELYGSGLDARCLIHLNDVSNIIEKLITLHHANIEPVIISTSNAHTIIEITDVIAAKMEF